jgi:hypothetical protein
MDMSEALGPDLAEGLLDFLAELGTPPDVDPQEALRELAWEMRYAKVLDGPPGWIPPLGERQLLGIRIRSGTVETMALDRREVGGPHVGVVGAQVARLARLVIGPDRGWSGPPAIAMEELLELVATEAPELLRRPLPPFSEVVERGGLEVHDGWVGHRGTDWHAADRATLPGHQQAWGFQPDDILH